MAGSTPASPSAEAHGLAHHVSPAREAWRRFRRHKLAVLSAVVLLCLVTLVVLGPWVWKVAINDIDFSAKLNGPSLAHPMGTDDRGRDVLVRLAYGFNISMTFALVVAAIGEGIGIAVGAMLGYFGGKLDILGQRGIEIWSSLPFLYTIIIISSVVVPVYLPGHYQLAQPSFWLLVVILSAFDWMGITYYVRGEFYREKVKDYVGAAMTAGVSDAGIIFGHILPNALTPVVSFAPFVIVANIGSLVALDFLGFGLPAPTPSWGELIGQGMSNLSKWWLVFYPNAVLFVTLLLVACSSALQVRLSVVDGESMAPSIRAGDSVVTIGVPVDRLSIGSVLLVRDGDRRLLHRLRAIRGDELWLQGDASLDGDRRSLRRSDVLGQLVVVIPTSHLVRAIRAAASFTASLPLSVSLQSGAGASAQLGTRTLSGADAQGRLLPGGWVLWPGY